MTSRKSFGNNIFSPVQLNSSLADGTYNEELYDRFSGISLGRLSDERFKDTASSTDEDEKQKNEESENICKSLFDDCKQSHIKSALTKNSNVAEVSKKTVVAKNYKSYLHGEDDYDKPFVTKRRSKSENVTVRKDSYKTNTLNSITDDSNMDDTLPLPSKKSAVRTLVNDLDEPNKMQLKKINESKCVSSTKQKRPLNLDSIIETADFQKQDISPDNSMKNKEVSPTFSASTSLTFDSGSMENESSCANSLAGLPNQTSLINSIKNSIESNQDCLAIKPSQMQINSIEKLIKDAVSSEFDGIRQMIYLQHLSLYKFLDKSMEELKQENYDTREVFSSALQTMISENQILWSFFINRK